MRALLQRVSEGRVTVQGDVVGAVGRGYVILLGVGEGDTEAEADRLAEKIVHLRLFCNDAGKFDRSLLDVAGGALVVSQFTLYGDAQGQATEFQQGGGPGCGITVVRLLCAEAARSWRGARGDGAVRRLDGCGDT